ncbi:hypothetical protein BGZ76_011635 [Entomortierella beljakovae]|nr:hypothetical protein BGZ76_011635 [Entomortierella beljakovae]
MQVIITHSSIHIVTSTTTTTTMASRRFIVTCSHHCHCQNGHSAESTAIATPNNKVSKNSVLLPTPPSSPSLIPSSSSAPDSPVFSTIRDTPQSLPEPLNLHEEQH